MSLPEGSPSAGVTLCMVVHTGSGNLASALHSVNRLTGQMMIVDAGGAGGQAVKYLVSEYGVLYFQIQADSDESSLFNTALDYAKSPWALFLYQKEVLQQSLKRQDE